MSTTFLQLQTALASMWGYESVSDLLDQDLADLKAFINAAYMECYSPADGKRLPWAKRLIGIRFRAPATISLTVTQDSKVVTGYGFPDDAVGSMVKIGESYYTYAGYNGTYQFVEPVSEASGTYTATLYHSSYPLAEDVTEVVRAPELQGYGPLSPMNGREAEMIGRGNYRGDFDARDGSIASPLRNQFFTRSPFLAGVPIFYRIEMMPLLDPTNTADTVDISAMLDAAITTLAQLAALATTSVSVPTIRGWINGDTGVFEVWRLLAGTDATDGISIQRPDDYNAGSNAKVWYKAST